MALTVNQICSSNTSVTPMLINNTITLNRLYVSLDAGEKHAALLAEISRLREGGAGREADPHPDRLQPCRGAISINNIQLPLKVEFVCSARTGECVCVV